MHVSRPGNGICHAVHVARFGVPGKLSMGGDSHTPHGGSIGMLCIGVGWYGCGNCHDRCSDAFENAADHQSKLKRPFKTGLQCQGNHSGDAAQSRH
ncbi:MAG: aconitase family protein [Lachnospiraceae bacterium]